MRPSAQSDRSFTQSAKKHRSLSLKESELKYRKLPESSSRSLKRHSQAVSGVISIVAPTITAFGLALMGVQDDWIAITALVSLTGFLFRLYQSNEQFRNSVTTVWSQVTSVISSAITALQPVFDAFSQYFGQIAAELAPQFAETMNVMVTSLATLKPAFADLGAAIAELGPTFAQLGTTL
ncbi:hypothetical protein ES965_21320 (plasmid) [Bacillus subtilis]|uniref:hypothetical protein n=1 Tax=Bacillus subtilis TaxID=1423 RepID=UPI00100A1ECF|nr:hypothetical protein [Bacillus subtilis]QAV86621.1 hypothetical protein ES965_21320 [Bacillus subtilis]